ncbi:MAG: cysteate synthase [Candidatus Omnitrophica bacterium]|nr:cysteate synthase [Candidatus Omnitrophota bacterium]
MGKYVLKCLKCGRENDKRSLVCENGCDSLLRTEYEKKHFLPNGDGLFKYIDWLPCEGKVPTKIGPVVYKAEKLGEKLGLKELFCSFNGYWPEKNAENMTGTFKDYEALPTIIKLAESGKRRIILASAGNTARAFAYATTQFDFETFIVMPESMLERLWVPTKDAKGKIRVIAVRDSHDYFKAIQISDNFSREYGIEPEGGARNTARRDGMGTVMLEGAKTIGHLPDHYFQAVGSGTGGIAAYEAALRLMGDKKFDGQPIPRLHLAQNYPFAPIYRAWKENMVIRPDQDLEKQLKDIAEVFAEVLANRNPPYNIKGGVRDVLDATNGDVYLINNKEAVKAAELFESTEGIDITPASAVCFASLIAAAALGKVCKNETVLLNITGGGIKRIKEDFQCVNLRPDTYVDASGRIISGGI